MSRRFGVLIGSLMLASIVVACGRAETSYPTVPPVLGWEKFEGNRAELWLPPSYEGGEPSGENLQMIVDGLRRLGPEFEPSAQVLEQHPSAFVVFAVDSEVGNSGTLTSMNVAVERVPYALNVDTYMDIVTKKMSRRYHVVEHGVVPLDQHEAGRLVSEIEIQGVHMKTVTYVVKDWSTMWILNYGTAADEFEQRLPVFEESARSFTYTPQPMWKKILEILWVKLVQK